MLKQDQIKIGEAMGDKAQIVVNITEFSAVEAWNIRSKLTKEIKQKLPSAKEGSPLSVMDFAGFVSGVMFETPIEFLLILFKNCTVTGVGSLAELENLNKVFESNLDGITELALEVVKFNGFFTKKLISTLANMLPREISESIKGEIQKHLGK